MITARDIVLKKEAPYNSILPYLRAKQAEAEVKKEKAEKPAEKKVVEKND